MKIIPNITNQNIGHVEFVVTVFAISLISIENLLFEHKICSLHMVDCKIGFRYNRVQLYIWSFRYNEHILASNHRFSIKINTFI